ncbi:MAG: Gldg family protein [Pseudomonadota bacterium]
MAMRRGAPSWLTLAFAAALVALFLGERLLSTIPTFRLLFSLTGAAVLLATFVWRLTAWLAAEGKRRRVERILLLGQLGCAVALLVYFVSSEEGMRWSGLDGASPDGTESRWPTIAGVLWPILLFASLLPLLLAQWAHGAARHLRAGPAHVEAFRVAESAASGLTISMAASALFLFAYVTAELDAKVDASYFRTSMPGSAITNMVKAMDKKLRVLLFFPAINDVRDEAASYFGELSRASSNVQLEWIDRVSQPQLARKHRVTREGTVILAIDEQSERIEVGDEMRSARQTLRQLDEKVHQAFLKVARPARVAYVMTGHGELNDQAGVQPDEDGFGGWTVLKQVLTAMNYQARTLGLAQGSAEDVPADATMVMVLGPKSALLKEEIAALDRYLSRGGSLFLALDPLGNSEVGTLEHRLGVHFDPVWLADDRAFVPFRRNHDDHRMIVTASFSSHAAVTTLGRGRNENAIVVPGTGHLTESAQPASEKKPTIRPTWIVRSLASTFVDPNANSTFDAGEKRDVYNLAAAVEQQLDTPPTLPDPSKKDAPPQTLRALFFADSDMFSDFVLAKAPTNLALVVDSLKWLGREEKFAGETVSEKDVLIQHTQGKDVAWFYSTIIGAPVLVLLVGLFWVFRHRRHAEGRKAQ